MKLTPYSSSIGNDDRLFSLLIHCPRTFIFDCRHKLIIFDNHSSDLNDCRSSVREKTPRSFYLIIVLCPFGMLCLSHAENKNAYNAS